jgi:hypothetical protein
MSPIGFSHRQFAAALSVRIVPGSLVCLLLLSGIRCLQAQSDSQENNLAPAATSAREVLQGVRDSFARIRSIHYTYELKSFSALSPRTPSYTSKSDGEFALDNGRFYSSVDGSTTRDNGSKWFGATAFDGSQYQQYDSNRLMISSQMPESPYPLQPVMYPFMFARTSTGRLTFEETCNQQSWDELGNRAKLEPSEIVNGHPCDVVSFTKQSGTTPPFDVSWKVYAARDLGCYPVRETTSHGNSRSVLDVTEWKVVPGATGNVVIPIKIVTESRDDAGSLVQSKSYSVRLISVNEAVNEGLFSLMRFKPERVRYVD